MDIPGHYKFVSIRLTKVLDESGLGENLRWWRINTWLQLEELNQFNSRIVSNTNSKLFFLGSQAEATTTAGLSSDIDMLAVKRDVIVLQDLQFWEFNPHTQEILLMVTDDSTPPGYVKLQLVQRDAPVGVNNYRNERIQTDSKRRSVLGNANEIIMPNVHLYRQGPASSMHYNGVKMDMFYSLQAHFWPSQASQWLSSRVRRHNWPTRQMIDVIQQTGVLLVPVGQKLSSEKHLEWRLSFSLGEKLLMINMNSTQYKCYVMLKFIKNAFINVNVEEQVITSYHCKTCMFYLMESTPSSIWIPNNLLFCIDMCLRLLLSWIECQNCPNYFIPEENMFLGRNMSLGKRYISSILHNLLKQEGGYLKRILYENIGERLCQSLPMELVDPNMKTLKTTFLHLCEILGMARLIVVTRDTVNHNVSMSLHGLREEVFSIVRLLYCSCQGMRIASQSLEQDTPNQEKLTTAHELLLWGTTSDLASGYLQLAAFYLATNNLNAMEVVLNKVKANLKHNIVGLNKRVPNEKTISKIVTDKISLAPLVRNYFYLPVYYVASDIHSIPKAFIMEIFRSTASEPSLDTLQKHWIPMVGVEANVYHNFLQYQCYHLQRRVVLTLEILVIMIRNSLVDIHCMNIYLTDTAEVSWRNDIHLEKLQLMARATTNLNLLAYCLTQSMRPMDAFKILCKSMKMKNHHNAAMWQIATFIFSIVSTTIPQAN